MQIRPFVETDTEAVIGLWSRCDLLRPWNDPQRDITRKLAVGRMASARADHTLTPTALAHEASLKMLGDKQLPTDSRGKFFAFP